MKKLKFTALLLIITFVSAVSASAAARIPVYRVDDTLLFFDKSTGEISGFAGEPTWLTIPEYIAGYKVTSIGRGAFSDCRTLRSAVISEGISYIGENAFYGCTSLSKVTLASTVSFVGDGAFKNCVSLSEINFNGSIETVAENAFDGTAWINGGSDFIIAGKTLLLRYNGSAEYAEIPSGVTRIAARAFAYSSELKSIVIPEGVTEIGNNAFVSCYNLYEVVFPSSIVSVGIGAFDDTIWLRNQTEEFVSINNVLIAYNGKSGCVNVPDGITSIGSGVFMSNEKIYAVSLPSSLKTINEYAFIGASSLSAVTVPDGVEWIDDYTFSPAGDLTLFGSAGSYAQYYSALNNLSFSEPIGVVLNGERLSFEVPPIIIHGAAYAPLRTIAEKAGLDVSWNETNGEVTVNGGKKIVFSADSTTAVIDGEAAEMSAPPINMRGQLLLPLRGFSDLFGFDVSWDGSARCAVISTGE